MKLFILSHTDYEEYSPYLFTHENKTDEEFESDVKMLFKKCGDEYIAQETCWIGAAEWTSFVAKKLLDLGYVHPKTFQINTHGAGIIRNREHDGDDRIFARDFIGEELLQKAVAQNKIIEDEMYRKFK